MEVLPTPGLRVSAWKGRGGRGEGPGRGREGQSTEWQLPVHPSPGHTHKQLLVTIPSHSQTKHRLQLHKSPT